MPEKNQAHNVLDALRRSVGRDSSGGVTLSRLANSLSAGGTRDIVQLLTDLSKQTDALRTANDKQSETLSSNTEAILANTVAQHSRGAGGTAGMVGKAISSIFGAGLGLAPGISTLVSLFGSKKQDEPPPLTRFSLPPAIHFDAANTGLGTGFGQRWQGVDYGQDGMPRVRESHPQVTVQVRAMDSRSFIDHSHEIAAAVRHAMLNMHSVNDVVNDL